MCDKCSELDKKIERFKNLAGRISDQQTLMPSLHWLQSKRLKRPRFIPNKKSKAASVGRPLSFHNLILEGNAFGIVFLKPGFRGVRGGEDLDNPTAPARGTETTSARAGTG
jgi:hypothetical protein